MLPSPHAQEIQVIDEVRDLVRRAKEAGKRLATLALDTEVRAARTTVAASIETLSAAGGGLR